MAASRSGALQQVALELEVWRTSRRKQAIAIKRI
jgi:hypothetical protein